VTDALGKWTFQPSLIDGQPVAPKSWWHPPGHTLEECGTNPPITLSIAWCTSRLQLRKLRWRSPVI